MNNKFKTLTTVTLLAMFAVSCGSTKKTKKRPASKSSGGQTTQCLTDCAPSAPSFNPSTGGLGSEGYVPTGKDEPGKYEPGKYEPGKYEPGKYEPGKYEPGKTEPSAPVDSSTPVVSYPSKTPAPAPAPEVNACLKASNYSITVGGQKFYMTRYTTKFYTTLHPNGVHGNYVTILNGQTTSINSALNYHVKDGVLSLVTSKDFYEGTVVVSSGEVSFANIEHDASRIYSIGGGEYDVAFDLAPHGACLARYGNYSGGYPVLVLP